MPNIKKPKQQKRKQLTLPDRFVAQFWDTDADQRCSVVKEIRRRYEQLKTDAGAESYQKDLIVQRAVFIACQLESMEITAAQSGELNFAVYTQATNALVGLLKALGLEKKMPKTLDLERYIKERRA